MLILSNIKDFYQIHKETNNKMITVTKTSTQMYDFVPLY